MNRRLAAAGGVLAAAAALFAVLTYAILHHSGLTRIDNRLLHDVISLRSGPLTVAAKALTDLGTGVAVYAVVVAGLVRWRRLGDVALPVLCVGWLVAGQLLRIGINRSVARPRPPASLHLVGAGGYAFPSGHTTTATIGYGLLAVLLAGLLSRASAVKRAIVVVAVVLAVGVGLSRIYLGVHWPTDVLGGWALGASWLALGALLRGLWRPARRRFR